MSSIEMEELSAGVPGLQENPPEEEISSLGSIGSMGGTVQPEEQPQASLFNIPQPPKRSFWESRNKLEKTLLSLLGSLTTLLFILIAMYFFADLEMETETETETEFEPFKPIGEPHYEGDVCLTPKCIKTAAQILSSLDLKTKPCEDFYQFACGNWENENPIPEGKTSWGNFGRVEMLNLAIIRRILETPLSVFRSEAEKKAKFYYDSCMDNNDMIEKLGVSPIKDLINKIGGWHVGGDLEIEEWSLQKTLQILHNDFNLGGLFSWTVGEDEKNSSRYIIHISHGGISLPVKENYTNQSINRELIEAYFRYMVRVGYLLGIDHSKSFPHMRDVLDFEMELALIMPEMEDMKNDVIHYNLMTLADLQRLAPFVQWQPYFSHAFNRIRKFISSRDEIVVRFPFYLRKLSDLVSYYMKTYDGRIIVNNYLVWQAVQSLTWCLPRSFRDAFRGVQRILIGRDGQEELWQTCVSNTNNVIGFATGAMFVRQVFQPDYKATAQTMINEIRDAIVEDLENYDWMDDDTRNAAIKKARAITDMIGFPEYILDPRKLDDKYKDLDIRENEYFMNNIRVNQYNFRRKIEKLNRVVNKSKWEMIPSAVNAYYTPTKNQIVFPAGIMRTPFFDTGNPPSLNYGGIGVIMGHELMHALDDLGREFDLNGNLNNWWRNETIERFKKKANCLARQYSGYSYKGRYINGNLTLAENIADFGGVKAAFEAYESKNRSEFELPLPGLNFTHRQLFFISFAQLWCTTETEEEAFLQMDRDLHAPSKYRVNGVLVNLRDFGREFNCGTNTMMNPRKKCY